MTVPSVEANAKTAPRFQFSVRTILAVVWLLSCWLAAFRLGAFALIACGIPLGILGFRMMSYGVLHRQVRTSFYLPMSICTALTIAAVLLLTPANLITRASMFGGVFWLLALPTARARWLWFVVGITIFWQAFLMVYCWQPRSVERYLPLDGTSIQDVRGGRMGRQVLGLLFETSDGNTPLLEEYLGAQKAEWRHHCYLSPYVSDGNERVNICSIIRSEKLPDILDMLPHQQARRQVLFCVTDPDNLLRVHQGLLLMALLTLDFPPGHDARSWWEHHSPFFRQEYHADQAAITVWGWRDRLETIAPSYQGQYPIEPHWEITRQSRAARYQEQGSWGGDSEMGTAFEKLNFQIWRSPTAEKALPELGMHRVAWWPDWADRSVDQ